MANEVKCKSFVEAMHNSGHAFATPILFRCKLVVDLGLGHKPTSQNCVIPIEFGIVQDDGSEVRDFEISCLFYQFDVDAFFPTCRCNPVAKGMFAIAASKLATTQ